MAAHQHFARLVGVGGGVVEIVYQRAGAPAAAL